MQPNQSDGSVGHPEMSPRAPLAFSDLEDAHFVHPFKRLSSPTQQPTFPTCALRPLSVAAVGGEGGIEILDALSLENNLDAFRSVVKK